MNIFVLAYLKAKPEMQILFKELMEKVSLSRSRVREVEQASKPKLSKKVSEKLYIQTAL